MALQQTSSGGRGADTRRRIELAAAERFADAGYAGTTMQAIADSAGVHVQTIYLAYRTKAAVLAATAARLVAGDEDPAIPPRDRAWSRAIAAEQDPRAKLKLYVVQVGRVAARITRLTDTLRAAAPSEPEAAAFLAEMERGRREGAYQLLGLLAHEGLWNTDLSADQIADVVSALASPDTLRWLTERCGWDPDAARAWTTAVLERELLAP